MKILVLASAARTSGALTIYKQFLFHLPKHLKGNEYYIFVDPGMPQPELENVKYIHDSNHTYRHRIYMDRAGYMIEMTRRGLSPDVVFSLQNTGCITKCKQVIYYHQSLPFYPHKWNPFKKPERTMFLYKYFYPLLVKRTLNKDTEVVVQIPFIKRGFVKRFKYDSNRVHVAFPDIEKIDVDNIVAHNFNNGCFNFIFPAGALPYKGHMTIVKALDEIRKIDQVLAEKVLVHFTIESSSYPELYKQITSKNLIKNFVFHGTLPHKELLSFYKGSNGLLYPSTIETLGLPLLEAAAFGLPILAANLDYAHEVIGTYKGVEFAPPHQYKVWAEKIYKLCINQVRYLPVRMKESEWTKVFELITKD